MSALTTTTMSSVGLINELEGICKFSLSEDVCAEDIALALDAFDSLTEELSTPRPRVIVLLYLSLIQLLGNAYMRESQQVRVPGVYVIEYSNGTVKIGRTGYFEARRRTLSTQGGLRAVRSKFFPCDDMCKAESMAHSEFKGARLGGEFFQLQFDQALLRVQSIAKDCKA